MTANFDPASVRPGKPVLIPWSPERFSLHPSIASMMPSYLGMPGKGQKKLFTTAQFAKNLASDATINIVRHPEYGDHFWVLSNPVVINCLRLHTLESLGEVLLKCYPTLVPPDEFLHGTPRAYFTESRAAAGLCKINMHGLYKQIGKPCPQSHKQLVHNPSLNERARCFPKYAKRRSHMESDSKQAFLFGNEELEKCKK